VDAAIWSCNNLIQEGQKAGMVNTRISKLAAVDKMKKAACVAELMGGAAGAFWRGNAYQALSDCLRRVRDMDGAAWAACASLRAARESGNRTILVTALCICGEAAWKAPNEMVRAERESREQERRSGSPSYNDLDLSQEGRISLPTTPAALSRLPLAYHEAAVAICDAALAAAGGRSPAAADGMRVPELQQEARARGCLGACLDNMGEEHKRSFELLRQAVALQRQVVRTAAPGRETLDAQR